MGHRIPNYVEVRRQVAERDGLACWLCPAPIKKLTKASLDHRVPRSAGGGDELENLKLAHPECNWRRGSKPEAETLAHMARVKEKRRLKRQRYKENLRRRKAARVEG